MIVRITGVSASRIGQGRYSVDYYNITIHLEHQPSWLGKLFGRKPYTKEYFSRSGINWYCVTDNERVDTLSGLSQTLFDVYQHIDIYIDRINAENAAERLAKEAEAAIIALKAEEKRLQDLNERSRFEKIE